MVAAESILRTAGRSGKISWDMVHPQYRGKSLGTRLLRHRIEKLEAMRSVRRITSERRSWPSGFYEKRGFELKGIEKDYWAEGFDLYRMEYVRRE